MSDKATIARLAGALAVLVGGLVHLQLYFDGYRDFPNDNLGRSFLANGVASVVIAAALVVRRDALVRLAGIGVALGTLAAFVLTRNDVRIFGLRESGLEPSPQALIALIAELAAVGLLAVSFLPKVGAGKALGQRVALTTAGVFVVGSIVLSVLWNQDSGDSSADTGGGTTSVSISDFAFRAAEITVSVGDEVTWTNADSFAHSVVATDGSFVSESLSGGESFSHSFDQAGAFNYVCGIHASMTGTIIVTD